MCTDLRSCSHKKEASTEASLLQRPKRNDRWNRHVTNDPGSALIDPLNQVHGYLLVAVDLFSKSNTLALDFSQALEKCIMLQISAPGVCFGLD
jgi:hypothetical protein